MNKFKVLVTFVFVTAISIFSSQSSFSQAFLWEFGVEGGAGLRSQKITNTDVDSLKKTTIGFIGGVSGQYNLNDMYSLKLGAYYERKGQKYETSSGSKEEFNHDYLNIPLLLKAKFGNKIKFFVNAGPFIGVLLKSKFKGSPPDIDNDNTSSYKKTEIGISGGAGVIIPAGRSMNITFEVRDDFGLTNIFKSELSIFNAEVKTNNLNLMAGISFLLGKKTMPRR
ncbi:MAG: porin family protein [bacterium]|nr:porin family protein [bacterium]